MLAYRTLKYARKGRRHILEQWIKNVPLFYLNTDNFLKLENFIAGGKPRSFVYEIFISLSK